MREVTVKALPGERVALIYAPDVDAVVITTSLGHTGVTYEVAWFAGEVRYSAWLHPSEFNTIERENENRLQRTTK